MKSLLANAPTALSPYVSTFPIAPFGFEGEGDGDGGKGGEGQGDQGQQGGQGNSGAGAGQGQGGKGSEGDKGKQGNEADEDDEDDEDDLKSLTPAELKRRIKAETAARKQADKDKKALEDANETAARSKRDKLTNAEKDLETEKATSATLRSTVESLALTNSILNTPEWEWHNVEVVLPLLDRTVVTTDDDGKVQNLKKDLKRIATDHPYLLKSKQDGKGNQGGQQGNGGQGRTGIQPGQGGANNGGQQQLSKDDLAKNGYPALIGRR